MIVSVPAPPPMVARPPPCPACNSTAVVRISESRIRMATRTVYMRGARYLGDGGAHKLRPTAGIERRPADQYAIQFGLGQQLGGVFQIDAAAIKNHERDDRRRIAFQPAADCAVDFGGVLWGRVASGADRPHGLVRDVHVTLAGVSGECGHELPCDDRHRVTRLALRQGLADAQDRLQVGRERRGEFFPRLLIGFAKHVPALGVSNQRHATAGLRDKWRRDGSRKCALRLPIDVLRSRHDVPVARDILRHGLEGHGGREKPHGPLVGDFAGRKERPQVLPRFGGAHMHLPVRRKDQGPHASSSAATPGNSFPSRNSSDAPPPVETCVSLSSIPATAATESPPPTTVTAPFFPASTRAFAIARVPASNGGVSNTPIGPFQKIVLARSKRAAKSCCVVSSMSNTAQPLGIASAATERCSLARSSDGAITPPRGRISFLPLVASSSLASAMRSGSTNEPPTSSPIALKNVHAMAPPMSSSSTRGRSERMTSILPEIFAPPSTAMNGCLGLPSSWPRN